MRRFRSTPPLTIRDCVAVVAVVVCVFVVATGCDRRVGLGELRDGAVALPWIATFEPGDLSEWAADGAGGTFVSNVMVGPVATTGIAHGGQYAGKITVAPTMAMASYNYLLREAPSPTEGYYSAWFYLPSPLKVPAWLSIIHFRGSHTGDGRNVFPTFDINLYSRPNGDVIAHLWNYSLQMNTEQDVPIPVTLDRWVHFEVFLRKAAGPTGRIAVWQDDALIIEREGIITAETDWVEWNIGGASEGVDPTPAVMYVDDAAISLSRRGTTAR